MSKGSKKKASKEQKAKPKGNQRIIFIIIAAVVVIAVLLIQMLPRSTRKPSADQTSKNTEDPSVYDFKKEGEVRFIGADGNSKAEIDVEIADELAEITLGLMYREDLLPDQGMLFIFPDESPRSFWMLNTILRLDMIFANSDGEIVTIHEHTVPYSQEPYISTVPAVYVVEVNAGFVNSHDIMIGDRIEWERIAINKTGR